MEPAIGTPNRSLLPLVPTLREQPCETFSQPPLDGSLCTAEIYEWHARHSPNHPVLQYLEDDGTVKTITFADAIHAIYRGGWLLRSAMQGSSYPQGKRQIVATVALSGTISYCTVTLATQMRGVLFGGGTLMKEAGDLLVASGVKSTSFTGDSTEYGIMNLILQSKQAHLDTETGPLEAILNRDDHISRAIMFGRGRFNVGVLVDPIPELRFDPADTERLAAFRNLI